MDEIKDIQLKDEILNLLKEKQKEIQVLVTLYYAEFIRIGLPETFIRELVHNYHTMLVSFMLDTFVEAKYEEEN